MIPRPPLARSVTVPAQRADAVQTTVGVDDSTIGIVPEVETSYHAASRRARDMASWFPYRVSPDAAFIPEMDVSNARIEDLIRNNGIARGARRTIVDNVIGPRITCKPSPDRALLKISKPDWTPEFLSEWSQEVEAQWNTFADTAWFDASERNTFHSMTRLAVGSLVTNGEALALPMWIQGNGRGNSSRWFTRLQMVHPARLSNPNGQADMTNIRGGVEVNENGAPIAYHIRKTHPGELNMSVRGNIPIWERVPASQTWGRLRVLHLYEQEDVGQTRGVSTLTTVLRQFKMFDRYSTEELRQAVLNALIFAALETPMQPQQVADMFGNADDPMSAYNEAVGEWNVDMRGGMMVPLPPGTKLNPFIPSRPSSAIDQFSTVILRHIAAGLNMPYELLFKDFSKTNYSSARAAMLEAWRYFTGTRQVMIDHWIRPIYDLWFEEAVNRDRIPDVTPDDYYNNQVLWTRALWLFAPRGWVDPLRENKAQTERMKNRTSTLATEVGEQGLDWRDTLRQQADENALAAELGLPPVHVAAATPGGGGGGASSDGGAPGASGDGGDGQNPGIDGTGERDPEDSADETA